jgi:mersacidin/lichenicidin family type 2 lantibiotic
MNPKTIIRAWKDPEFRAHLTSEERRALPDNPSGQPMSELGDEEMADVVGGASIIQPTPPIFITRGRYCITRGSAVDACPTGRGCSVIFPC